LFDLANQRFQLLNFLFGQADGGRQERDFGFQLALQLAGRLVHFHLPTERLGGGIAEGAIPAARPAIEVAFDVQQLFGGRTFKPPLPLASDDSQHDPAENQQAESKGHPRAEFFHGVCLVVGLGEKAVRRRGTGLSLSNPASGKQCEP
jgi:hypothetical protein